MKAKNIKKIILSVVLGILMIFHLFPVFVMISSSIKSYNDLIKWPPKWIVKDPQIVNYEEVLFGEKSILNPFLNSLFISLIVMILCIIIGILAAYSVTRFEFIGKKTFLMAIILTQMFSPVLLVNPMYLTFRSLNLLDTRISLIVANLASSLPMTIWLLYSYFSQIPKDYEESSWMDGCSRVRGIFDIILPLAMPGIITAGLFAFIASWGDIVFARTFITSFNLRTISQALTSFEDLYKTRWELQMAASVITSLPPFLIFLSIQKKLIQGMTTDGVKG